MSSLDSITGLTARAVRAGRARAREKARNGSPRILSAAGAVGAQLERARHSRLADRVSSTLHLAFCTGSTVARTRRLWRRGITAPFGDDAPR
ncbi:hypothetical protein [Kitasatospora sp. A2-31]|uniref:hypothetical protein n=1 Tax=Kitasatospora sp. A2-31 TaxID=2916414 RepID=UPI001EEAB926|nr:hypothetical protein [Kitasatospora sp. A2-31]MCG6498437.1 hypothetical protein [Kitasatospora sp. A2-31]